jgi:predicted protein tyrosine phosphatase
MAYVAELLLYELSRWTSDKALRSDLKIDVRTLWCVRPSERSPVLDDDQSQSVGAGNAGALATPWVLSCLETKTGGIRRIGRPGDPSPDDARNNPDLVLGWYFDGRSRANRELHGRKLDSAGTHVPYGCPACGTSYARRKKEMRLSPLRNFRAGFGKTTQLLATELFDAQRNANPAAAPKLVSFSDSRQDAAKGALSIERNHTRTLQRAFASTLQNARAAASQIPDRFKRIEQKRRAIAILEAEGFMKKRLRSTRSRLRGRTANDAGGTLRRA